MEKIEFNKEGCQCCKCKKFIPENHSTNCPANNYIIMIYTKFRVTAKVSQCPMFEEEDEN